jgi:exoribonuclease R
MLPTILSDNLCSLQAGVMRIALTLDIHINSECEIISTNYLNSLINVSKNYIYDEPLLIESETYLKIFDIICKLSKKYNYINNVKNSHDVISYLMIFMNYYSAKELLKFGNGIFRTNTIINSNMKLISDDTNIIPDEVKNYITIWNSSVSQYVDIREQKEFIRHDALNIDAYIHITSPIRRLVDLLNIIKFQEISGIIKLSNNAQTFYKKWLSDLEYINTTMRSIRKVQCDCTLLDLCANNPSVMEKEYEGYLFDKIIRNDGLFQYIVFLPELKLSSRITLRDNLENFSSKKIKLFLFNDEENFKKKIRLHVL